MALFVRVDPFQRFVSCLVFAPRDRYDTELRLRFQEILTHAWGGTLAAYYTHLDDSPLARLQFYVETPPGGVPAVDAEAVERRLVEAARSWSDRLEAALSVGRDEAEAVRLVRRYAEAFPTAYRDHFLEQEAVADLLRVEEALTNGGLALSLYRPLEAPEHRLRFKIFATGEPAPLSQVVPVLENMGFRVLGEVPYRLRPAGVGTPVWMREFHLETADAATVDLESVREPFHDAFRQVWVGTLENDGFNRLVLGAGLPAREVTVLRAYCKFLRQARMPFSQAYVEQTLASQPRIARYSIPPAAT